MYNIIYNIYEKTKRKIRFPCNTFFRIYFSRFVRLIYIWIEKNGLTSEDHRYDTIVCRLMRRYNCWLEQQLDLDNYVVSIFYHRR